MPRHIGIVRNRRIQYVSRMTRKCRCHIARAGGEKVVDSVAIVSTHLEP